LNVRILINYGQTDGHDGHIIMLTLTVTGIIRPPDDNPVDLMFDRWSFSTANL